MGGQCARRQQEIQAGQGKRYAVSSPLFVSDRCSRRNSYSLVILRHERQSSAQPTQPSSGNLYPANFYHPLHASSRRLESRIAIIDEERLGGRCTVCRHNTCDRNKAVEAKDRALRHRNARGCSNSDVNPMKPLTFRHLHGRCWTTEIRFKFTMNKCGGVFKC